MPRFKKILQIGNGINLGDASWRRHILEGAGHDLQAMDGLVFCRGRRDSAVSMAEFNSVRDDLALGIILTSLKQQCKSKGGPM